MAIETITSAQPEHLEAGSLAAVFDKPIADGVDIEAALRQNADYYEGLLRAIKIRRDELQAARAVMSADLYRYSQEGFSAVYEVLDALDGLTRAALTVNDNILEVSALLDESYEDEEEAMFQETVEAIVEQVESGRHTCQSERRQQLRNKLNAIIASNVATVSVPGTVKVRVTAVNRWQHDKGLSSELADAEYMRLMAESKAAILESFDRPLPRPADTGRVEKLAQELLSDSVAASNQLLAEAVNEVNNISAEGLPLLIDQFDKRSQSIHELASEARVDKIIQDMHECTRVLAKVNDAITAVNSNVDQDAQNHVVSQLASQLESEWQQEVDNVFYAAVKLGLEQLQESLGQYQAPPAAEPSPKLRPETDAISAKAVKATGIKVNHRPLNPEREAPRPVQLHTSDFLWLIEANEEDRDLEVEQHGTVGFVDGTTKHIRSIEAKGFGRRSEGKLHELINSRIQHMINLVATADNGHMHRKYLDGVRRDTYPYSVFRSRANGGSGDRVYFTLQSTQSEWFSESAKEQLRKAGVEKVLVLVGACRLNQQEELLREFTGRRIRVLRKAGAGQ